MYHICTAVTYVMGLFIPSRSQEALSQDSPDPANLSGKWTGHTSKLHWVTLRSYYYAHTPSAYHFLTVAITWDFCTTFWEERVNYPSRRKLRLAGPLIPTYGSTQFLPRPSYVDEYRVSTKKKCTRAWHWLAKPKKALLLPWWTSKKYLLRWADFQRDLIVLEVPAIQPNATKSWFCPPKWTSHQSQSWLPQKIKNWCQSKNTNSHNFPGINTPNLGNISIDRHGQRTERRMDERCDM